MLRFSKKEFMYCFLALGLFFQIYLQDFIGVMQYFDELVTIICLIVTISDLVSGKTNKDDKRIFVLVCMIAIIGFLSNMLFRVQDSFAPIVTDFGNTFKVFFVYLGAKKILGNINNKKRIISRLSTVVTIFVIITFLFCILHEIGIVSMGSDVRFGLKSFQFINKSAGNFSIMFYSIILLLTLKLKYKNTMFNKMVIVLALIVWCSTLRSRAVLFTVIYLYLIFIIKINKGKIRINIPNIIVIVGAGFIFCMDQVDTYFSNAAMPRYKLLYYGIETMKKYFPLGSGFGTYGTDAAAKYYSPLYIQYGFNSVWGMTRDDISFLHDTYWPAIGAQFGLIGLLLTVLVVYYVFKNVIRNRNLDIYSSICCWFITISLIASSVATSTFFHYMTVGTMFLIPLAFKDGLRR